MYESNRLVSVKSRWLLCAILVVLTCLLIAVLLLSFTKPQARANYSGDTLIVYNDSPNAITSGMYLFGNEVAGGLASLEGRVSKAGRAVETTALQSGRFVSNVLHASAVFAAQIIRSIISFAIFIPRSFLGFTANTAIVSAVIKPASITQIPTISSASYTKAATQHALSKETTAKQIATQTDFAGAWPVHGGITTYFGVPHWPYQPTHTGLDISDGQSSGVTPVKPFRPGKVISTLYSDYGLGNNVIVDHGGGLTSLYAHLASIDVYPGQSVNYTTALGTQGTTGASTGTHVHFEIRVGGQPVDPLKYVNSGSDSAVH